MFLVKRRNYNKAPPTQVSNPEYWKKPMLCLTFNKLKELYELLHHRAMREGGGYTSYAHASYSHDKDLCVDTCIAFCVHYNVEQLGHNLKMRQCVGTKVIRTFMERIQNLQHCTTGQFTINL
mmetsp:Transcript_22727/g.45711  ORF Transcript_22727/g.45711 Transcript_22727/m.45711 type:complete len:122 (+) Transcript_22727:457-822(+)